MYFNLIFIFSAAYNIRLYKKNELFTDNADQSELYKVEEANSGSNNYLNLLNKVKMVKHVALTENNMLLNESSSSLNFKYDSGNFLIYLLKKCPAIFKYLKENKF